MNEKQVKLLRYFVKWSKDKVLATTLYNNWDKIPARKKGKITTYLKKVIVTLMHVKSEQDKAKVKANMEVLKGFVS